MLPLFSRPPAAGPRQAPFSGRLLAASFLFFVMGSAALAFPLAAPAYAATASSGAHAMKSKPCLHVVFWERQHKPFRGNAAVFNMSLNNYCGFPVRTIRARYSLVSNCDYKGSGDQAGNFPAPDLAAGGSVAAPLLFHSYCIDCPQGVMTFPPFSIDVSIVAAAGFSTQNSQVVATMGPDGSHEATATLLNDAGNSGGLRCPGNGELPSS